MTDTKAEQQGHGWRTPEGRAIVRVHDDQGRVASVVVGPMDVAEAEQWEALLRQGLAGLQENADLGRQLQTAREALAELYWTVAAHDGTPLGIAPAQRHLDKARAALDAMKCQP